MVMKIDVDPNKDFHKAVEEATKGISDLRLPLREITKHWYQGNKAMFTLSGPGKWDDLSPGYKKLKERKRKTAYPLLKGENGRIESATTKAGDVHAINQVLNKKTLVLGVKKTSDFPYAASIHYGYSKNNLPARPYLFLGPEKAAPDVPVIKNRGDIYLKIIQGHCIKLSKGFAQ